MEATTGNHISTHRPTLLDWGDYIFKKHWTKCQLPSFRTGSCKSGTLFQQSFWEDGRCISSFPPGNHLVLFSETFLSPTQFQNSSQNIFNWDPFSIFKKSCKKGKKYFLLQLLHLSWICSLILGWYGILRTLVSCWQLLKRRGLLSLSPGKWRSPTMGHNSAATLKPVQNQEACVMS